MTHAGRELLNQQKNIKAGEVEKQHGSIGSRTGTMASGPNLAPVLIEKAMKTASDFTTKSP